MSDRETKLAQSYEHYYWNSVEFLNRLKSTKVGWYGFDWSVRSVGFVVKAFAILKIGLKANRKE